MRPGWLFVSVLVIPAGLLLSVDAIARDLGFDDRIRAQEAIDRVYYVHQVGVGGRFEDAVPRPKLEEKVRTYLKQTAALERRWHVRITAEMLRSELVRITRNTRMPDRLREIFAALGDDAFVIQECLVRPLLAERLGRERFASDSARHAAEPSSAPAATSGDPSAPGDGSEWWRDDEHPFDPRDVAAVATSDAAFVLPAIGGAGPCLPDQTWDNESLSEYRVPRTEHSAVWTGSVMLIWGGESPNLILSSGARYDPAIDTFAPMSTVGAPAPRTGHAAVWTGTRMVVWGGTVNGALVANGGRYDPQSDTWAPVSQANAPEPRFGTSVLWTGARMIVWGGHATGTDVDTGRSYDPINDVWTATSQTNAPEARYQHTAVWTGTRMLVWGGIGGGTHFNTGGLYDPSNDSWSPTSLAGAPSPRRIQGAVWTGHYMVVWGGVDTSTYLATGGRYEPATDTWLPTTTTNAPPARIPVPPVWTGSRMVVFGGYASGSLDTGGRYDAEADLWSPTSAINAPTARDHHTMVWTGSRVIVWGGGESGGSTRTGAQYDPAGDQWTPTNDPGAPSLSTSQSAVWTGNEVVVWGGQYQALPWANTGGRYDPTLDSWRPVSLLNAPATRFGHTAVWTGTRMLVWGGQKAGSGARFNDGGQYDPIADVWTTTASGGAPTPRSDHSSVWTGTRLLVWGGISDMSMYLDSGAAYDPVANTWAAITPVNAPSARANAQAVWTGTQMLIWGGGSNTGVPGPAARYDLAAGEWKPISGVNAPTQNPGSSAIWTGQRMVVWGGSAQFGYQNTGGIYDPALDSWTATSTIGAPAGRALHTAVWTGARMIVWGGFGNPDFMNTGGIYDPVGDTWQATSLLDAPRARQTPAVAWTGRMMVIYGGDDTRTAMGTGGRFAYGMYADVDHDGYSVCDGDCDDLRAGTHPGAAESCNGIDDDCDTVVDNLPASFCSDGDACTDDVCGGTKGCLHPIRDGDGDGFGDVLCGGADCDDHDPLRFPGAPERCNGLDDNCDGVTDEGGGELLCNDQNTCTDVDICLGALGCSHHARDFDGDGHGDANCGGDDCTDVNPSIWFPAIEVASLSASTGSPTRLAWTDQGPQVGPEIFYLLVSGPIPSPGISGFAGAACLQADMTTTYREDRPNPPVDTAYWYLARAVNDCGAGSYGTAQRDAALGAVCY